jgi:hypothetical protein
MTTEFGGLNGHCFHAAACIATLVIAPVLGITTLGSIPRSIFQRDKNCMSAIGDISSMFIQAAPSKYRDTA